LLPVVSISIACYAIWSEVRYRRSIECFPVRESGLSVRAYPCFYHSPYPAAAILFNQTINSPVVIPFFFAFPRWRWAEPELLSIRTFVLLLALACWWSLIGLELDMHLLRRSAGRSITLHYLWLGVGTIFQTIAVFMVFYGLMAQTQWSDSLVWLVVFCWSQVLAIIFLRSLRRHRVEEMPG